MRGYTMEKLEHLSLMAGGSARQPVLAYLLQETHLPAGSMLLGAPVDYVVWQVPSPSTASHEGHALLLHPAVTVLWQHLGHTVAAVKVGWPGFVVTLVSVYVPPLTRPHRGCLVEAGLLPTEAASLLELDSVLELLDPQREPMLLMGDFNARTATLAPSVDG